MKKRLFYFLLGVFLFLLSMYGCTASNRQKALCYSGCVLATIPKCVKRCQKPILNIATGKLESRQHKTVYDQAKQLQKEEKKKASK